MCHDDFDVRVPDGVDVSGKDIDAIWESSHPPRTLGDYTHLPSEFVTTRWVATSRSIPLHVVGSEIS